MNKTQLLTMRAMFLVSTGAVLLLDVFGWVKEGIAVFLAFLAIFIILYGCGMLGFWSFAYRLFSHLLQGIKRVFSFRFRSRSKAVSHEPSKSVKKVKKAREPKAPSAVKVVAKGRSETKRPVKRKSASMNKGKKA